MSDEIDMTPVQTQATARRVRVPEYKGINRGASMIGLGAAAIFLIGFLSLCAGIACIIFAFETLKEPRNDLTVRSYNDLIEMAVTFLGVGVSAIVASVLLRLLKHLALAIRDMARNSFR